MLPSNEGKPEERKPYQKPEIVEELELEARAGTLPTPIAPDLLNPYDSK